MELRHLRYFIAVAQGGFNAAAERRLRTAQPSLSRQIRDLELEVGVKLLGAQRAWRCVDHGGPSFSLIMRGWR
jgi:DNA-binding transcriptional LysR family regulator